MQCRRIQFQHYEGIIREVKHLEGRVWYRVDWHSPDFYGPGVDWIAEDKARLGETVSEAEVRAVARGKRLLALRREEDPMVGVTTPLPTSTIEAAVRAGKSGYENALSLLRVSVGDRIKKVRLEADGSLAVWCIGADRERQVIEHQLAPFIRASGTLTPFMASFGSLTGVTVHEWEVVAEIHERYAQMGGTNTLTQVGEDIHLLLSRMSDIIEREAGIRLPRSETIEGMVEALVAAYRTLTNDDSTAVLDHVADNIARRLLAQESQEEMA